MIREKGLDARIPKRWLPAVRGIWLALMLVLIAIPIAATPAYFNRLRST